ncbi:MAG: Alcohol dehydrogenase superfamily, zinc-containing, partial [uncultured Rubrobacteraceae bacterium]
GGQHRVRDGRAHLARREDRWRAPAHHPGPRVR